MNRDYLTEKDILVNVRFLTVYHRFRFLPWKGARKDVKPQICNLH